MQVYLVVRRENDVESFVSVKLLRVDALEHANDLNSVSEGNRQHFVKNGKVEIIEEEMFPLDLLE